jgi:cell division protein FtsQ
MSEPPITPPDDVPDTVLAELGRAFSEAAPAEAPPSEPAPEKRTILIADDGLPDAIEYDRHPFTRREPAPGGPERIVIESDDDLIDPGDELGADDTGGPAAPVAKMDPRIRARRIAVRRAVGRRRLRWLLLAGIVVAIGALVAVVLASPLFSVRQVRVDGAAYTEAELLDEVVASLDGEPIMVVDLAAAEERLETSPWVRDARVTRRFPDTVVIEIAERTPLAFFQGEDQRFRVIDDEGRVLAVLDGQPIDYVPVAGAGPDVEAGASAGGTYRAAAQLVEALPDELRPQVANLGVTEAGELTMTLVSGAEVRLGRPDDLQAKLVALVVVLRRQGAEELTVIDLSSGEPTVR